MNGFHVRPEHVRAAICHEFKGGIGTASRVIEAAMGGWTVGVLVQANYGRREWLRVDGVPVGEAIPKGDVPSPHDEADAADAARREHGGSAALAGRGERGSIIILVATDAPLLPHQCERIAQRAGLGLARAGGTAGNYSGDLFLTWATGDRGLPSPSATDETRVTVDVRMVADRAMDPLFDATIEATEESIVNALVAAETMVGRDGVTAHALPHDRLLETMARFGRPASPS